MGQLERRAEAISGEFNSQEVANTLWALATMGTTPGDRLMGQLKRRAEAISGEFNSQDVANTLWAISFFYIQINLSRRFFSSLSCSLPSIVLDDQKILCQLHQVFISYDIIEGLHADLSVSLQGLRENRGIVSSSLYLGDCPPF